MMGVKRILGCGVVAVVSVLVVAECSSGTSGSPNSDAAKVVSVSVPADVPKDSIRDLNSTKDMSGVVTTIPENQSPYVGNLPQVCPFLPKKPIEALGAEKILLNLDGEYIQSCRFQPEGIEGWIAAAAIYTVPYYQFVNGDSYGIVGGPLTLPTGKPGVYLRNKVLADSRECVVAWGTFYGVAEVSYNRASDSSEDECARALEYAKIVEPALPREPAQMRRGKS
ncbi:hypothetical protein [Williamsia sp. CHRR-6]|uniref:hypothetical protein n=1 Tax=Williamsia sp. CHRR-6 TaxID=2835871 RepID=UPI001BDA0AB7|nr:hypothetical protein [Williamsia sp. CHRR-6]MBT0567665.1 hypothetical protein [Williamsia sp. CHRR-6]